MITKLKKFFSDMFWKNVDVSKKPLTNLSILFVIIFDIFLFNNILNWYNYQWNIITRPYDYHKCNILFNQSDSKDESFISTLNSYFTSKDEKYSQICNELNSKFTSAFDNELATIQEKIENINSKISQKDYEISLYENEYSKYKSENYSWISSYDDRLSNVNPWQSREKYVLLKAELEDLKNEKNSIVSNFSSNPMYLDIKNFISLNKDRFDTIFEKDLFWYPVKVSLFQALLLFPVFLISLFWYKLYLRRQNRILTILFSNLTFISWIFVFVLFFKFIYFILPKKFFASLILMLQNLNLWFLWNYILIFVWILIFGFIIYLSQKWSEKLQIIKEENEKKRVLENKQRIVKDRYFAWKCIECNSKLLPDSKFCSHCWFDQFLVCGKCNHSFPKAFNFCDKCGTKK